MDQKELRQISYGVYKFLDIISTLKLLIYILYSLYGPRPQLYRSTGVSLQIPEPSVKCFFT
jgi:hypothetical protein